MINALIVSAILLGADAAPKPIAAVNEPTEAAKAVYLADAAAKKRGHRSELAVLGTAHLSGLPDGFDIARFGPLVEKLAAWAPDRITVESLSGAECDYLRAYAFAYEGTADTYCPDPAPARQAFGVTAAAAEEEIERTLAAPVADRPAAERRRLAGLFLAVGDPSSALVQWLRLAPAERKAADGLTDELVDTLEARARRKSENTIIAAAVAVALGHERLYPVDDHTGDRATGPIDEETYGGEMTAIWKNEWVDVRHDILDGWDKKLEADPAASITDWYLMLNSPEESRRAVAGDFGAAAGADVPANSGRKYLAYWETRNMRMAANIREVIGEKSRVLAIVGASHKTYYERYLGVTSDLEIVDMPALLR